MQSLIKRLLTTTVAYQLGDIVSKVFAVALLPVYTHHLTRADYGTAELILTTIILSSIVLRLGLGEAFVRFHYLDADPERRRTLARTAIGTLLAITTVAALLVAVFADPVSRALLDPRTHHAARVGRAFRPLLGIAHFSEQVARRRVGQVFRRFDVVLAPTTAQPHCAQAIRPEKAKSCFLRLALLANRPSSTP